MSNNKQAQEAVLGAILCDAKRVMPLAANELTADDFLSPDCQRGYSACLSLFQEQKHIDVVTVLDRLGDEAYRSYLVGLVEAVPSVSAAVDYIGIVAEESRRADAAGRLRVAITRLQNGDPLEEVQTAVSLAAQSMGRRDSKGVDAAEGFQLVADSLGKPRQYIKTGFQKLDGILFISPGDFVVIGARPSAGKTALSLQMALHMARSRKVVYFSCETSAQKLYERALACYGKGQSVPAGEAKKTARWVFIPSFIHSGGGGGDSTRYSRKGSPGAGGSGVHRLFDLVKRRRKKPLRKSDKHQ